MECAQRKKIQRGSFEVSISIQIKTSKNPLNTFGSLEVSEIEVLSIKLKHGIFWRNKHGRNTKYRWKENSQRKLKRHFPQNLTANKKSQKEEVIILFPATLT